MTQTKCFRDESGKTWKVTRAGSNYKVENLVVGVTRIAVAASCARKLGVTDVELKGSRVPFDHLTQHILIWKEIWPRGTPC